MELYATAFDAAGALDKLEGFASFHGPDFYGLPRNTGKLTLVRETYQVPDEVPFGNTSLVPLAAGEALAGALRSECRAGMAGRNDPRKSPYIYKQGFSCTARWSERAFSPRFQQLPAGEFLFQFALQFGCSPLIRSTSAGASR